MVVIFITGEPCTGKSSAAKALFEHYDSSAFFAGDRAWRNSGKSMPDILAEHLKELSAEGYDYIFLASALAADKDVRDKILAGADKENTAVLGFMLTCSEETLLSRRRKCVDKAYPASFGICSEPCRGDCVIDTDNKTVRQTADEMIRIINEKADNYEY